MRQKALQESGCGLGVAVRVDLHPRLHGDKDRHSVWRRDACLTRGQTSAAMATKQGNRVKDLMLPPGLPGTRRPTPQFALHAEGILAWSPADQVVRHVSERDEIGWGVIFAHAAFVIAE
ncbi:MAG: hypothetical protein HC850_18165, partial [Rhodomicrobium sp.]|nr:hypothetical protein [Rhodomicrobium sp.]